MNKSKEDRVAEEANLKRIYDQVYEALDNATHENGHDHEYALSHLDTVLQIHDWSEIEGFDPNETDHVNSGHDAVLDWRRENPQ